MEGTPPSGRPLRPLGAGERLDRAVTSCVRFFVPLALVDAVATVARGAYNLYTGEDAGSFWTTVAADIRGHTIGATALALGVAVAATGSL